ncbi:MAG: KH domain-containing protein [Clostridia bacterium]|nr:KH domain-containing protein [Clostridia bacterium]
MESVEITAKKIEDAVKEGLDRLSATIDEVDVQVLEAGGFFGKAKIIMSLTDEVKREREKSRAKYDKANDKKFERFNRSDFEKKSPEQDKRDFKSEDAKQQERKENLAQAPAEKPKPAPAQQPRTKQPQTEAKEDIRLKIEPPKKSDAPNEIPSESIDSVIGFIKQTLAKMGVQTEIKYEGHGFDLDVDLCTDDSAVIGYRGETLDSLEYLAGLVANKGEGKYVKLSLDSNGYRFKQIESVIRTAEKMANKCVKQGRKVCMEPMNSATRKIIHAALSDNDKVVTKSEGKEPNRRIVIYCKRENGPRGAKAE